ncbi:DUF1731 domain-containing protein [Arthrobacter wenxiniae]|uniref:DUF1731 domain-containing protein n=1 Tax=Arthrobacter wenxiniae TaxID=2713570 RepID=UPI003CCDEDEE
MVKSRWVRPATLQDAGFTWRHPDLDGALAGSPGGVAAAPAAPAAQPSGVPLSYPWSPGGTEGPRCRP